MGAKWLSVAGIAMAGSIALAGCGPMPDDGVNSGNPVVGTADAGITGITDVMASPDPAMDVPASTDATPEIDAIEAEGTIVSLKDGKLDPFSVEAQPGDPVVLTVNGDGAEHTFEIKNLVDSMKIAASGQTNVEFVAAEEPGTFEILIDGKPGGEFKSMDAAGQS